MPRAVMAKYAGREANAEEKKIDIVEVTKTKFKVKPSKQGVQPGAWLTWYPKGTAATVSFDRIAGQQVVEPESVDILDGGEGSLQVQPDILERIGAIYMGRYADKEGLHVPYKVYCDASNSYAEADSDPKIIIR
jgi:hypothetical protein